MNEAQARFERIYPYLKRKKHNFRLIARIRRLNNDYILCWLTVFRRGDRENFAHHSLEAEVDANLAEWLKEKKAIAQNGFKPSLPSLGELQIWLEPPRLAIDIIDSRWQKYLLPQQIGVVFEKIGSFVETLNFYELSVSNPDPQLSRFARERWLATKQKQEKYFRQQVQIGKAQKAEKEWDAFAQKWQISFDSLRLEPPHPPKKRPKLSAAKAVITGLPEAVSLRYTKNGVAKFQILHTIVKVMRSPDLVLLIDALSKREVRFDIRSRQIIIGTAIISAANGDRLCFSDPSSGYSATLICESDNFFLELDFYNLEEQIRIEF